ncbi:hypothetical protein FRC07_002976 [Ceratobasidium sp. 392]|nr:hypothetical protein FRC07_002976 [Ceratobasidium sp. 392]
MVETRTVVAISAVSVATALAGYLVYFDYKRRNDPEFRKKLRKEKKKIAKTIKPDETTDATPAGRSQDDLKAMLALINAEPLPTLPGDREKYFMEQVGVGEQLLARGPAFEVPAALSFYRALRSYPSPVEIIMIFQNTLPPHIFAVVMELASLDVSSSESELAREPAPAHVPDAVPVSATVAPIPETAPISELEPETPDPESEPSIHESEVIVDAEVESVVEVETEAGMETEAGVETEPKEVETEAEVKVEASEAPVEVDVPVEAEADASPKVEAEADAPTEPVDPASVPVGFDSDDASSEVHSETESHHEITSQDGHPSESEWDQLSHPGASQAELPPQQHQSD